MKNLRKRYCGFFSKRYALFFAFTLHLTAENGHFPPGLNLTHAQQSSSFEESVEILKQKIKARGDLPHISIKNQLDLVDQLCQFEFGRYILERKGANGYWTDYLISYDGTNKSLTPIENFILNRSLIILAHRERFKTYQRLMQGLLTENIVLASIPCGLMRDLITLDFSKISRFKLVGLDIDLESLALAKEFARRRGIENAEFFHQDAWQMRFHEEFDVITSSGLNVYEPDPARVLELYKRFYAALKPGGSLIISVLTYPPGEARPTDWNMEGISSDDLYMERVLHHDILDLHWRNFRSAEELEIEFKQAGFSKVTVYFDKHRIFPTIHAQKG